MNNTRNVPVFGSILVGGGAGKVVIKMTNNVKYNFRKVLKGGKQGDVIENEGCTLGQHKMGEESGEGKALLLDT